MTETKKKPAKKMPFAPVRPRRTKTEDSPRMTERQRAARKRQNIANQQNRSENRSRKEGLHRGAKLVPGEVRITGLIADELTRAFAVILKLDGPADQLMKAFFKSNPKLGARDRQILAEAIFFGLRHLGGIAWRMKPMKPARVPRVSALLTLMLQYGPDCMNKSVLKGDAEVVERLYKTDIS